MAPLPSIADTWRVAFNWSIDNMINVLHIHAASETPAGIFSMVADSVTGNMWTMLPTGQVCQSLSITPLFDMGATFEASTDGTSKWHGSQAGDYLPAVAAVVSLHTAFRGPANRGRAFLGPVAEASVANGILDNGNRTGAEAAWAHFGSELITHDAQHVVASYKHATALTVVNYSIRPAAGTMRPRQSRLAS